MCQDDRHKAESLSVTVPGLKSLGWSSASWITYSMVQSPSWEANWSAGSQETLRISRSPKVHYRTHKRPPPISILGQPNPVHIHTSHFLEIHPNIRPSTPRSPKWSPSYLFVCCAKIPLETLPPGDPSGGVVYLPIVLCPEESSCLWVLLNTGFNREGLLAPRPTPKLEDQPSSAARDFLFNYTSTLP